MFDVTPKRLFLIWVISDSCNRSSNISTTVVISYGRSQVVAHVHVKSARGPWGSLGSAVPCQQGAQSLLGAQEATAEVL